MLSSHKVAKVLPVLALSLGLASTAFADASVKTGFYGSLSAGVNLVTSQRDLKQNSDIVFEDGFNLETINYSETTQRAPSAQLDLGYGLLSGKCYFGFDIAANMNGEVGQHFSNYHFTLEDGDYYLPVRNKYQLTHAFEVAFKPGVLINKHTLAYGKIGVSFAKLEREFIFSADGDQLDKKDDLTGILFGLGLSRQVSDHVAVFAEYNYVGYGSEVWEISGTEVGIDYVDPDSAYTENSKISANSVKVGFSLTM